MKRVLEALVLTALAAVTVALAQTSPQRPADQSQRQQTAASDQSTATSHESSKIDKQALIDVCVSQVQVSNPSVPRKAIANFCAEQVNRLSRQD